ncbi:MAG: hypothetical protein CM1200mP32_11910 [Methanobacteriota archaeon]|nr:MAG: hypothetical protein CM1200mP32_11910 [Euryarchaeota archaeon]
MRGGALIAVDATAEDRVPEKGDASACTILHAVSLAGDGPEALQGIKEFLGSRCSGWRKWPQHAVPRPR